MSQALEQVRITAATTYFQLIEKVGSKGKYQRNVMLIFALNWYVAAILLLGTSFLFMNPDFDCEGHGIETDNCEETICAMDESEWSKYVGQKIVNSLATDFGPYYCSKGNVQIDTFRTLLYFGTFVGYFVFLFITDNFGRKLSLLITWGVTLGGILLLCIAQNMPMACIGLFFAGAGCESAIRISMAMLSQIVQYNKRQQYSILLEISFGFSGALVGLLYWLFKDWRTVNIYFCLIPCFIELLLLIFYLEETPKFLIKKYDNEKIQKCLNRVGKINTGKPDLISIEDIENVRRHEGQTGKQFEFMINPSHLFSFRSLRYKSITCCLLFFCLNYLYLGPIIIVNKLGINPFVSQVVLSSSELIAYPISFIFIKKTPRVKSGFVLIGLSTIFTGILIFIQAPSDCNGCFQGIIQIILVFGSRFTVSFYFAIFFLYATEIFPMRARGLGFGIASAAGALGSTTSQFVLPTMEEHQINPMILFTSLGILHLITLKFMEQTLNKPLQTEIEEIKEKRQNLLIKAADESPTHQIPEKHIELVEEQLPQKA